MTWMSDHTVNELRARRAELIQTIQEHDQAAEQARQEVLAAERNLTAYKDLADRARRELNENAVLMAIAQGNAPIPSPAEIRVTDDGLGLALGGLRIALVPDGASAEQLAGFAETMRALYAAASGLAHRADESAKAAAAARSGARPWTPDIRNDNGGTTVVMKRACNGCGNLLGDATDKETEAAAGGQPLPDVRGECPRCNGTLDEPPAAESVPDRELPIAGQDPYRPPTDLSGAPIQMPADRDAGAAPSLQQDGSHR